MEVIRKLIPLDVWAALMTAIVAAVFAVVFRQAPFFVFLAVALALCVYIAKTLSDTGPNRKGIGCALIKLSPDRSMKPQRDVWLIALPNGGNLLPSDAISQAVKLNVSRSCFLLSPSYSPRLLRNNSLGLSRSHPDRASASMCSPILAASMGDTGRGLRASNVSTPD
jgi:hypothetical protein